MAEIQLDAKALLGRPRLDARDVGPAVRGTYADDSDLDRDPVRAYHYAGFVAVAMAGTNFELRGSDRAKLNRPPKNWGSGDPIS